MKYTVVWGYSWDRSGLYVNDNCDEKGRILAIYEAMKAGAEFIEVYEQ